MNPLVKLSAFALAIAAAFGAGFGMGELAGPFGDDDPPPAVHGGHP